jgi:tRNA A37 threonylcarbamoyladenosine dehydratase
VADISKTSGCALARIMRKECAKRGIKGVKVVYSEELPMEPMEIGETEPQRSGSSRRSTPGSTAFVPGVAGLIMAGEVIKDLCK